MKAPRKTFADRAMSGDRATHRELGIRFFRHELFKRLEGRKVRFKRDVDRGDFLVPTGRVGTLLAPFLDENGQLVLGVQLRTPPAGSEEYDGEVHWREGVNLDDLDADLALA